MQQRLCPAYLTSYTHRGEQPEVRLRAVLRLTMLYAIVAVTLFLGYLAPAYYLRTHSEIVSGQ